MADSLPGTISLFSEAYAELMNTGETGQAAQARFYQDIATGSIVSAEILPIFARLASERAQPKLGVMKTMSIAEQGRFGSSLSDLMLTGSESGVEEGFAEFWRSLTNLMKGAQPIIRGLSGAFRDLMSSVRPFVSVFSELNNVLASFSEYSGIAEKDITKFGLWAAALATPWGRLAGAMMIVAEIMEDIAWGVQGKGSTVTGDFFDALEGWGVELDTFEKTVLGAAAAFGTLYAAIKAVQGLGKAGGLLGGRKSPSTTATTPPAGAENRPKRGFMGRLLGLGTRVATPLAIASGVNNSFEFENEQERFGFYLDPEGRKSWGMPVVRFGLPSSWLGNPETETGLYRDDEGTLRFGSKMFKPRGMDELNLMMRELGGDVLPFDPEYVPRYLRRADSTGTPQIPLIFKPEEYINYSNEVNGEHTRPPFRTGRGPTQGNIEHNVNLDVNVSLDFEDMDSFRRFAEDEVGPIIGNSIERTLIGFPIGE